MLQLLCRVCQQYVVQSNANDHLRSHSVQRYAEFDLEMCPRNIRDLIRVQIESDFQLLTEKLQPQIPSALLPKLEISANPDGLSLAYKIITGDQKTNRIEFF